MSAKYRLIILPEAQKDIREIVLYIARELAALQAALNIQDAFREGINSLAKMPERVKTVDEQPLINFLLQSVFFSDRLRQKASPYL